MPTAGLSLDTNRPSPMRGPDCVLNAQRCRGQIAPWRILAKNSAMWAELTPWKQLLDGPLICEQVNSLS